MQNFLIIDRSIVVRDKLIPLRQVLLSDIDNNLIDDKILVDLDYFILTDNVKEKFVFLKALNLQYLRGVEFDEQELDKYLSIFMRKLDDD